LHTITEQYNLVLVSERLHSAAGKVTVGLASHWSNHLRTGCLWKRDEHPPTLHSRYGTLYLYYKEDELSCKGLAIYAI